MRRVAVLGAGVAATAHLGAVRDLGWPMIAVATRRPERAAEVRALHPDARICWPPEEVFDADPDLVIVASPADTHLDAVRLAAARHVDVIVEKPLHARLDRAEELVATAAKAGIGLAVCLQHRAKPAGRALKSLELGDFTGGSISVPWWRPQSYYDVPGRGTYAQDGGGVLITQAIHALDLFLSVAGPPGRVLCAAGRSDAHRMEAEDVVAGVLDYGRGRLVSLHVTVAQYPGREEELVLAGTAGAGVLRGARLVRYPGAEVIVDGESTTASADPKALPVAWHRDLIVDAVEAFAAGREPVASGQSALLTQRVIAACYQSAARAGWMDVTSTNHPYGRYR